MKKIIEAFLFFFFSFTFRTFLVVLLDQASSLISNLGDTLDKLPKRKTKIWWALSGFCY